MYGIKNSITFFPNGVNANDASQIFSLELAVYDKDNKLILTKKGKSLCVKYDQYFRVAKKRTTTQLLGKGYAEMLKLYREAWPAGKLPSGKPARQNVKTLENAFRWFFDTYDYTWDEVTQATLMYIDEYRDKDYMYMKTSQYFICKQDKHKVKHSELADYCDMVRDGVEPETKDHFKEKVV